MTDDLGLGVGLLEVFQEEPEGGFLLFRTGIHTVPLVVLPTDVADTDGMLVVVPDVFPSILLVTASEDMAFPVDNPVVADVGEVAGEVPVFNVLDGDFLTDTGVRAMDDDVKDVLHGKWGLLCHQMMSQLWMMKVEKKAVMTVKRKLPILSAVGIRNSFIGFWIW